MSPHTEFSLYTKGKFAVPLHKIFPLEGKFVVGDTIFPFIKERNMEIM